MSVTDAFFPLCFVALLSYKAVEKRKSILRVFPPCCLEQVFDSVTGSGSVPTEWAVTSHD